MHVPSLRLLASTAAIGLVLTACGSSDPQVDPTDAATDGTTDAAEESLDGQTITVYSGRGEDLVGQVIADFEEATGVTVDVRYGGTSELAATILEEGGNSPADVYWAQDAGALGALSAEGALATLPADILDRVDPKFRAVDDTWVGVTGRVRTVVYNTEELTEDEVPDSVFDLTAPEWAGRVGWAPTNGSFQSFITAMRQLHGDDVTRGWVEDMIANDVQEYPKNTPIVDAAGRGEISVGLVNHYYLFRFLAEDPDFPAANKFLSEDVGGLVNVAGVGILESSEHRAAAEAFVAHLLAAGAQNYFGSFTDELEYPLAIDVEAGDGLPALESLEPPTIDLADLADLQGTLDLLREAGALT